MWIVTIALGFMIAYFILKFTQVQEVSQYLPGKSYYKSGPTVDPSPFEVDKSLIGVGLETRVSPTSVMDSGSPPTMVIMNAGPSPMMAMGNAPVRMTSVEETVPPPAMDQTLGSPAPAV
jgi:hypothetical protein